MPRKVCCRYPFCYTKRISRSSFMLLQRFAYQPISDNFDGCPLIITCTSSVCTIFLVSSFYTVHEWPRLVSSSTGARWIQSIGFKFEKLSNISYSLNDLYWHGLPSKAVNHKCIITVFYLGFPCHIRTDSPTVKLHAITRLPTKIECETDGTVKQRDQPTHYPANIVSCSNPSAWSFWSNNSN